MCTWRAGRFEPGCLSFRCDYRFIAAKAGADPDVEVHVVTYCLGSGHALEEESRSHALRVLARPGGSLVLLREGRIQRLPRLRHRRRLPAVEGDLHLPCRGRVDRRSQANDSWFCVPGPVDRRRWAGSETLNLDRPAPGVSCRCAPSRAASLPVAPTGNSRRAVRRPAGRVPGRWRPRPVRPRECGRGWGGRR